MRRLTVMLAVTSALLLPNAAAALDQRETRSERMIADLVLARPLGIVVTVAGGAAFLVTLPFALIGGNADEAADALFLGPARETFVRCLGCASVSVQSISGDR